MLVGAGNSIGSSRSWQKPAAASAAGNSLLMLAEASNSISISRSRQKLLMLAEAGSNAASKQLLWCQYLELALSRICTLALVKQANKLTYA